MSAAVALGSLACGGSDTSGPEHKPSGQIETVAGAQVYRAPDFSFAVPEGWEQFEEQSPTPINEAELSSVVVSPPETGQWTAVNVTTYDFPETIGESDLTKRFMDDFVVSISGEFPKFRLTEGPPRLRISGLPGFSLRGTYEVNEVPVRGTIVYAFRGAKMFYLHCQAEREDEAEVERGCEILLDSFRVH